MTDTAHAQVWESERLRLTALAYRVVGSWQDAEDVVAQAWLRLAEQEELRSPEAWLTTVVTRLAIDAGRRQRTRRESYVGTWLPEPVASGRLPDDVATDGSLLGLAMLRLMDDLDPTDRAVFVLREAFDVPYAEIAECVGRSPAACRQVVSRARSRMAASAGAAQRRPDDPDEQRLTAALVQAVRSGAVADVVRLLSDDCVLWADGGGVVRAARRPVVGSQQVANFLVHVARLPMTAQPFHVNGTTALLFTSPSGSYLYVLEHDGDVVTGIQVHANPGKLTAIGTGPLDGGTGS